jgi:outer membrane murein-binding lipoprotein Lpp
MNLTKSVNTLNGRIDELSAKVDKGFSEMHAGFETLGNQIGNLENDMMYMKVKSVDTDKEIQWLRQRRG